MKVTILAAAITYNRRLLYAGFRPAGNHLLLPSPFLRKLALSSAGVTSTSGTSLILQRISSTFRFVHKDVLSVQCSVVSRHLACVIMWPGGNAVMSSDRPRRSVITTEAGDNMRALKKCLSRRIFTTV